MPAGSRVLVAGVGNLFLGDDGFGTEVARRLADEPWPEQVQVTDYGIGGIHLAYDLLEDWDLLVLVDTASRAGVPGTLTVLELGADSADAPAVDAHSMDPATVFATLQALGGSQPRTLLVACEPASIAEGIGLSSEAAAAVAPAIEAIRQLVAAALDGADPVAAVTTADEGG